MGMRSAAVPHMIWALTEEDLTPYEGRALAQRAVVEARKITPKVSGRGSKRYQPIWGPNYFGIKFLDSYLWFQENGIKAFTMKNLKGKTIPMWIEDPTGKEREKNPKAETRRTKDGRTQVLIFRKATNPGSPGRIAHRHARKPNTTAGKVGGQIHQGNVGVTWRHPGLRGRHFLWHGIMEAAKSQHIIVKQVVAEWDNGHKEKLTGQ